MKKKWYIRKVLVYAAYIIFLSSFQVSFSYSLSLFGQVADLMLVFVILSAYLFGSTDAIAVGLITGFFRDYFSGPALGFFSEQPHAVFGLGMLLLLYAGVLSSVLFRKTFHRKLTLGFVQVFIITVAYKVLGHTITYAVQILSGKGSQYLPISRILFSSILPQVFVNLLVAVPIVLLLRYLGPYKNAINPALAEEKDGLEAIWQIV